METIDELKQVFAKYHDVVVEGRPLPQTLGPSTSTTKTSSAMASLLDLGTPSEDSLPLPVTAVTDQLADLGKLCDVLLSG